MKPATDLRPGSLALDREGRLFRVVTFSREDDVWFAWGTYPNGDGPDPAGRVGGTEQDPLHEHGLFNRKVISPDPSKPYGGYYDDDAWTEELGLRPLPPCERCGVDMKPVLDLDAPDAQTVECIVCGARKVV